MRDEKCSPVKPRVWSLRPPGYQVLEQRSVVGEDPWGLVYWGVVLAAVPRTM